MTHFLFTLNLHAFHCGRWLLQCLLHVTYTMHNAEGFCDPGLIFNLNITLLDIRAGTFV